MGKGRMVARRAASASNKTVNYSLLGGALATLTVYIFGLCEADPPAEVAAALTTIYTAALRYIFR